MTQELSFTTPGEPNTAAGWRHLAAPVEGVTVNDLAVLNLVQGVPGGGEGFPAQYEDFGPNVLVDYNPESGDALPNFFLPAPTTAYALEPGRGFFWYLYDNNAGPFSGGTSVSTELTDFVLSATGVVATENVEVEFTDYIPMNPQGSPRFYLIGNPFARPLRVDGITLDDGAGVWPEVLQVWDPEGQTYMVYDQSEATDYLAVWQGAFIQVLEPGDRTVTYDYDLTSPTAEPPFFGRTGYAGALSFRLDGTLASGATVADAAARLRFRDGAEAGWDRRDAGKLMPFGSTYALIAPVVSRDGAPYRLAVSTVPLAAGTVPVAFTATAAGTFTLTWSGSLPAGLTGTLRDLATGDVVGLDAGSYTFTADASPWADRFAVVLGNLVDGAGAPGVDRLTVGAVAPNPAIGEARLSVSVAAGEAVRVMVYDALGRAVGVAHDGPLGAAAAEVRLPVAGLAPGVYIVRIEGMGATESRRFTIHR